MKNTDLRIGNYVYHENKICEVVKIGFTKVWLHKLDLDTENAKTWECVPLDEIEPMVITEYFLQEIGLVKQITMSNTCYRCKESSFGIYIVPHINVKDQWDVIGVNQSIRLKYIHEVQNWYHLLKNKELKFKLKK